MTPEAMKQVFAKIPQSLIAMETGTHSPWVSRLLTELGHKVIVAHAQKVQLITKSNRKDDRHDARTLAYDVLRILNKVSYVIRTSDSRHRPA